MGFRKMIIVKNIIKKFLKTTQFYKMYVIIMKNVLGGF